MTVNTPPAPPLPDEVDRLLRRLRMPHVRHTAPAILATAKSQRWDPAEVLRVRKCCLAEALGHRAINDGETVA